jgi:hypothetical protein
MFILDLPSGIILYKALNSLLVSSPGMRHITLHLVSHHRAIAKGGSISTPLISLVRPSRSALQKSIVHEFVKARSSLKLTLARSCGWGRLHRAREFVDGRRRHTGRAWSGCRKSVVICAFPCQPLAKPCNRHRGTHKQVAVSQR